ncbi:hypothetical protein A2630_00245 [Candidatus Woesebacteria bacterium RIFCSPHIGHO2_01_FULL_44_10]|uniref:Aspartyl protease n=1 Tax=Candidatus Woesebacteria bacterium RIFCSPLOWO2_01_FULL_44_14 TaxID=1802525 RepID=A0A1F8BXB0_9BACT|nr:MAG: hypothetical protein A2630_00245 [Candidatus Woesebacteria bacterium RIFCSPHIGHO2_01_FULL_44_10]OGM55805.1 MAG: hypothetical protein A3F62_04240 [Candidatus Woesebacteria bacterium RIFCSPHIGHO2_12_FULL_44_11]OGM68733.1 MAG: hypothetical protein A2975_05545 [Candidatus Woesebacteria bacterium RIFCSPLOWO2_01_FULL_44_14]
MALTYLNMKVTNPTNGKRPVQRRMLVDSGAIFSVLPASVLGKLGIKPDSKQKFVLANGQEIEKEVGEARFIWKDRARTAPVVFGDEDVYLIGATTLENMGLILDPINRRLEKLPMLL